MSVFSLEAPKMPWGEYGDIMMHGTTSPQGRRRDAVPPERAGSFIPPISFVGDGVIVTGELRRQLEESGLTGAAFRPLSPARLAQVAAERQPGPVSQSPGSAGAGAEAGTSPLSSDSDPSGQVSDLWEIDLAEHASGVSEHIGPNAWDFETSIVEATWDGTDWFRVASANTIFVSRRAREWLERVAGDWVSFRTVKLR
ncbi:MAG: hypothetical protein HY329_23045 [Chloroflexi bacterium]|nr:hypothetical protein [Chloroflexota bacterium]